MKATKIHHVGVAVRDLDAAHAALARLGLGLAVAHEEVIDRYGVRLAILPVGGSAVELVQPVRDGTRAGEWMERHGEGLHHLCFEVEDIDASLADLKARGIALLDEVPRPGHHGSRIAFIDPRDAAGMLIELVEPAR